MKQVTYIHQIFHLIPTPSLLLRVKDNHFLLEAINDSFQQTFSDMSKLLFNTNGEKDLENSSLDTLISKQDLLEVTLKGEKILRHLKSSPKLQRYMSPAPNMTVEYAPLLDDIGNTTHIISSFNPGRIVDTPPEKQSRKRSEKRFEVLVEEGTDLLAILDIDGNYKYISEATRELLAANNNIPARKHPFTLLHPEDRERVIMEFQQVHHRDQVKIAPFRIRKTKDAWIWLETTAINKFHDPAIEGIVTSSRDITTTIEQAREIENLNERYRLAATATQDVMYDWDIVKNEVV